MNRIRSIARKTAPYLFAPVLLGLACTGMPAFAAEDDDPEEESGSEESEWSIEIGYKADISSVVRGGLARGARYLDDIDVVGDVDLGDTIGWKGASAHASLLSNLGGRPNDLAGTLQGVNNIEVSDTRIKVYEAWVEQMLGSGMTLRAGLYDLNSEFYQNDAAGLLIAPPFGIGSELSATGPNGPSIFPSTSLAARFNIDFAGGYARAAVVNAKAGTLGDELGVDVSGREGVLLIGEVGITTHGKIAVGGWTFTKRQPTVAPPELSPESGDARSAGVYLLVEQELISVGKDGSMITGFLRAGISDGATTPFKGGWQAGILWDRPIASRPESALSFGVGMGVLSGAYRSANPPELPALRRTETVIELTYSDEIMTGVSLQPDVQYIVNPGADPGVEDALVLGLRLKIDFTIH